jgi:hypothetical protein
VRGAEPSHARKPRSAAIPATSRNAPQPIVEGSRPTSRELAARSADASSAGELHRDVATMPSSSTPSSTTVAPAAAPAAAVVPPIPVAAAPAGPRLVPPSALEANRIAGDKAIMPDAATMDVIGRWGADKVVSTYKVCITAAGNIDLVTQMTSSGFPAYDDKIRNAIRGDWRYRPYLVNGKAHAVCTTFRFVYSQR